MSVDVSMITPESWHPNEQMLNSQELEPYLKENKAQDGLNAQGQKDKEEG